MVDVFETNGETTIMRATFEGEVAQRVREIRLMSATTFTEDFRLAVSIYKYMLDLERQGATVRAFAEDGMEEIVPNRTSVATEELPDEAEEQPMSVAINVNNETAEAIRLFADTEETAVQDILASVVTQYADMLKRSLIGEQFIIESSEGAISQLSLQFDIQ